MSTSHAGWGEVGLEGQWVPPGYEACTATACEAYLMSMGRRHAHLVGSEKWLLGTDRRGSVGVRARRDSNPQPPDP